MTPTELLFAAAIAAGILGVLSGHHKELVLAATILMLVIALVDMWGVSLLTLIIAAALIVLFTALRLLGELAIAVYRRATEEQGGAAQASLDTAAVQAERTLNGELLPDDTTADTAPAERAPDREPGERKEAASVFLTSFKKYVTLFGLLTPWKWKRGRSGD